jgi:hypothetical protein
MPTDCGDTSPASIHADRQGSRVIARSMINAAGWKRVRSRGRKTTGRRCLCRGNEQCARGRPHHQHARNEVEAATGAAHTRNRQAAARRILDPADTLHLDSGGLGGIRLAECSLLCAGMHRRCAVRTSIPRYCAVERQQPQPRVRIAACCWANYSRNDWTSTGGALAIQRDSNEIHQESNGNPDTRAKDL